MNSWKTRSVLAATAVAALLAGGAAPAFAASDPAVPADCDVSAAGFSTSGVPTTYAYRDGATSAETNRKFALGFLPTAWTNLGAAGDTGYPASFRSDNYAVSADGTLWKVRNSGQQVSQRKWDYQVSKTAVSTGWTGVRAITVGYPYLYTLTTSGIARYTYDYTNPPVAAGAVAATGFANARNLTFDRTVELATGKADVLLATDAATGALFEITVPHATPSAWTRTTLKTTGYADAVALSTGHCESGGRPMLEIESDGDAFVAYDPDKTDGSGSDFRGGTTRVASKWTLTAFSQ